jgi:FG-GAP-like repeat/WD40-like Beta Propeller Repeat
MSQTPSRLRARSVLVAAVAGALVAGVVGTAPVASGAPASDGRAALLKSFAVQARTGKATATPRDVDAGLASPSADGKTLAPSNGPDAKARTLADAAQAAPLATSSAADCAALDVEVTQTLEQGWVSWAAGATDVTVKRQRPGGVVTTLASGVTSAGVRDTGHNPLGFAAYTVSATLDGSALTCRSPEGDSYWSMSSEDGTGQSDVFFAGDKTVYGQDMLGPAFPLYTATAYRPAFSPTGRLVAAVEQVNGVWSITVRKTSNGALQWSVPSPADTMLDEPSFSPDGQRIVVEALALPALDTSSGLYTVPVNGSAHLLTKVPGSAGLVTADWIDAPGAASSTTIVAADLAPGAGLVRVNAATGARSAVAGSEGALDPMGLPDGSVVFTTVSDSGATLSKMAPNGTVGAPLTTFSAGSSPRWPAASTDGNIYHYLEEPDSNDPTQRVWSVYRFDGSAGTVSRLGMTKDEADTGFNGFDIRSPFSAGTSHVGGSANPDILARTSTGDLYAYPLSSSPTRFFDARVKMGYGWNVMKQFIAAGDVNSDRRGDVIAIDSSGVLWLYPGRGTYKFLPRIKLGTGWGSYVIFSTGDFDGDTRADLLARDSSGNLWMYPGNGAGKLMPRKQIGKGWSIFSALVGPGDWNHDGKVDVIARERSTGYLYLYPGNGKGGFTARKLLGTGWNSRNGFAAVEYWAGYNALFARTTTGVLLDYDSVGDGSMNGNSVYQAGTGWGSYTITG